MAKAAWLLAASVLARLATMVDSFVPVPLDDQDPFYKERMTVCVVDATQAVYSLGEAANSINAAVIDCPKAKPHDSVSNAVCSANAANALASFINVAAYTSAMLSDCFNTTSFDTVCSADVSGFMNGMATGATAISGLISGSCKDIELLEQGRRLQSESGKAPVDARDLPEYNQYLFAKRGGLRNYTGFIRDLQLRRKKREETTKYRDTEIGWCVLDVGQAVWYLTRAIVAILVSVQDCGPGRVVGRENQQLCTVQLSGVLGALAYVALYFDLISTHCPVADISNALCAADIISVVTVLTSTINAGASFGLTCGALSSEDVVAIEGAVDGSDGDFVAKVNRRLASNLTSELDVVI